mmetsp:Transcript_11993/g.37344  ORF Transcript_11993/g.37344 Transcript_11993/m.37344 type:complete len:202 (-) Transcript_11993:600-1205(-)
MPATIPRQLLGSLRLPPLRIARLPKDRAKGYRFPRQRRKPSPWIANPRTPRHHVPRGSGTLTTIASPTRRFLTWQPRRRRRYRQAAASPTRRSRHQPATSGFFRGLTGLDVLRSTRVAIHATTQQLELLSRLGSLVLAVWTDPAGVWPGEASATLRCERVACCELEGSGSRATGSTARGLAGRGSGGIVVLARGERVLGSL